MSKTKPTVVLQFRPKGSDLPWLDLMYPSGTRATHYVVFEHERHLAEERARELTESSEAYEYRAKPPEIDEDEVCPKSKNGRHEPDHYSVQRADHDPGEGHVLVDVNCKHCGRSGACLIAPEDVNW